MDESGLILEGGGMKGVYTAGVLEYFMEKDRYFPYVVGVSAGACNAASYLSRQPGRNKTVMIDYVRHPDYISFRNLMQKRELFGMDLIFDQIPNQLIPFDFQTFHAAPEKCFIGTTDCLTGQSVYFEKNENPEDALTIVRASSSLPFMSKGVSYKGRLLMDGGIADPIPVRKALADGVEKPVVVLTKQRGYRKKPSRISKTSRYFYKEYRGLTQALDMHWLVYNYQLEVLEQLEQEEKVFVIRPSADLKVGNAERDQDKLEQFYHQGYSDALHAFEAMENWLRVPATNV
ncbi:patatin-like phospholipase family protein [Planococcus beigongshangi]|uniref:patatin-like phospholipase family protein n=1 Tax=Planococcus beigongshangi TaxID=2782536 RepID=UPI00193B5778|nr:patatin family protein [Planococcus beigongshangi]